ncbi:MAG: hypothetical protein GXX96_07890 [Planctomycetaceae bacterium]|jgi:hypothetical protein|nr:hypothetical protein [Planctomycetaceae bacterium]
MSDFDDFRNTRLLRHPTTWILAAVAGLYGGTNMFLVREEKRAAGAELRWSSLGVERSVDFVFGAAVEVFLVMCAVWMLAGTAENLGDWKRFGLLLMIYSGIVLLKFVW